MKITKRQLKKIIREERDKLIAESRNFSQKGIMGIVKQYGGKRIPKEGPWAPSQYEFPDEQTAAKVVWIIHDTTGREAVNSGSIVSVYK